MTIFLFASCHACVSCNLFEWKKKKTQAATAATKHIFIYLPFSWFTKVKVQRINDVWTSYSDLLTLCHMEVEIIHNHILLIVDIFTLLLRWHTIDRDSVSDVISRGTTTTTKKWENEEKNNIRRHWIAKKREKKNRKKNNNKKTQTTIHNTRLNGKGNRSSGGPNTQKFHDQMQMLSVIVYVIFEWKIHLHLGRKFLWFSIHTIWFHMNFECVRFFSSMLSWMIYLISLSTEFISMKLSSAFFWGFAVFDFWFYLYA